MLKVGVFFLMQCCQNTSDSGLEIKRKTEVSFWRLTEKEESPISKFKSPEGVGAPKARKQIQNFPLTLTARQSYHMLNGLAKCNEGK